MKEIGTKVCNFFDAFCHYGLLIVAFIITAILLLANLIYTTHIEYADYEKVSVIISLNQNVYFVFLFFLLVILVTILNKYIDKINTKTLFCVFSILYLIAAVYLILNVDSHLRADPLEVYTAAVNFLQDNFTMFEKGGYVYRYPNQIGLVCLDCLIAKFSLNTDANFLFNFLSVLGINYFIYLTADELFENKTVNIYTIVISFAFIPQLFFIMFAYGLLPGFFMMMIGFYFTIKFGKKACFKYAFASIVFSSLAAFLKANFLIGCISVAIYMMLCLFKKKKFCYLVASLLVLVCMTIPSKMASIYFFNTTGVELNNGAPAVLWLAMGTDMDNGMRGPGWYNDYNWNVYTQSGYDAKKAAEMGKAKLRENFDKIREEKSRAIYFFRVKNVSQWTDPLYQSIWLGPLKDCEQNVYTDFLASVYNGGIREKQINYWSKFIMLAIWLGAFCFFLCREFKQQGWELLFIFFIGGFLFHTFWEAKSQYVYNYVFCLIPICSYSMLSISSKIKGMYRRERDEK